MKEHWRDGNKLTLLEDGDTFFPRVFSAIREAREQVFIETFILSDDKVGRELRTVVIEAAQRGVKVAVTVDGFGSPGLEGEFLDGLIAAGVEFRIFNPGFAPFGFRINWFRRLHRKIVVIDARLAFIGGINFIADQVSDFGPLAKRDYAVEIEGPVVDDIQRFAVDTLRGSFRQRFRRQRRSETGADPEKYLGSARVLFVTRDNRMLRTGIERQYHRAIRQAKRELIIANAYFFPGYRLLWRLRQAARRGVRVSLILQGTPDIPLMKWATSQLYDYLLGSGVRIYEYCERPLHGKVAIADDEWSTVGSSNLDPLSLSLNLEANVVILDRAFNSTLRQRLVYLMNQQCQAAERDHDAKSRWWHGALGAMVFHIARNFPNWATWLPKHAVILKKIEKAEDSPGAEATTSPPPQHSPENVVDSVRP